MASSRSYGAIIDAQQHVTSRYGSGWELVLSNEVLDFASYTNEYFGGHNTCSITTLTAVFSHHSKFGYPKLGNDPKALHRVIEEIARKRHYYFRSVGTLPFFIDDLARAVWEHFCYEGSARSDYFLLDGTPIASLIMDEVDAGRPGAISFTGGTYRKHTVTFHGYRIYERGRELRAYLLVNDNWSLGRRWVDLTDIAGLNSTFIGLTRILPPPRS